MPLDAIKAPKDIDNILVRLPARIKETLRAKAQTSQISQNAFISSAVMGFMLAGEVDRLGSPDNIMALVRAIDASAKDGFPIMGAFNDADWADLHEFRTMLEDTNLISDVRSRRDAQRMDTIVFAMSLTRVGRVVWPTVSLIIAGTISPQAKLPFDAPLAQR